MTEKQILKEFIQVYRDNVCLWDMSSDLYRNKELKHAAWGQLTAVLQKLDTDANLNTTKKKVENMRAVYFRELKKVRSCTEQGILYTPNLWYFKLISFLEHKDWGPGRSGDPLQTEGPEFRETIKQPPESDEDSMESADPEPEIFQPELCKRKWPKEQNTRKMKRKSETVSHNHLQTFVEPLHFEPKPLEPNKKTNSFGVYVGEQLEQIPTFQRHVAEKLISEVIFLAKTGNLNYDSKIVTASKMNDHSYSKCASPEYNVILPSPQKIEIEASDNDQSEAGPRTLLKELLVEGKNKEK